MRHSLSNLRTLHTLLPRICFYLVHLSSFYVYFITWLMIWFLFSNDNSRRLHVFQAPVNKENLTPEAQSGAEAWYLLTGFSDAKSLPSIRPHCAQLPCSTDPWNLTLPLSPLVQFTLHWKTSEAWIHILSKILQA